LKGCAISGVFSVLGFAAIAAAIMVALHQVYGAPPGDTVGVAIFAGFFAWMTANLLTVAVGAWRERSALLAGLAGAAPVDGRHTVLVGRIESVGPPLLAPFSGTPCVGYSFEVFQIRGGAQRSHKAVYYDASRRAASRETEVSLLPRSGTASNRNEPASVRMTDGVTEMPSAAGLVAAFVASSHIER